MRKNRARIAAFTLFEVILALMILGLLSGAVYSITVAALESTKATLVEQAGSRRLEAFVRITRDAFLNLPAEAELFLRFGKSSGGAQVPELVFSETCVEPRRRFIDPVGPSEGGRHPRVFDPACASGFARERL